MKLRAAASALLAGAILTILAGCGLVTPIASQYPYAPSDGVQGELGEVRILNALLITEAGNPDASLLFTAASDEEEALILNLQYQIDGTRNTIAIPLEANQVLPVGHGEGGSLVLSGVNLIPGDLFPIYFQFGSEEGLQLEVPVLDATLPQYEEFVPSAPVVPLPIPVPDGSETPAAEETPAA